MNYWGYGEDELVSLCTEDVFRDRSFSQNIQDLIESGELTEDELIENNVIKLSTENITIMDYNTSCGSDIVMPSSINNKNVKEIGVSAFYDKNIKAVKLPTSITLIGKYAFTSNLLLKVVLGNTNAKIGNCAFDEIDMIKSHNIPNTYYCMDE